MVTIGTGGLDIGNSVAANTTVTKTVNATVNISGGIVNLANSVALGGPVRIASNTGAGNVNAVNGLLNITGGTVTLSGNMVRGTFTAGTNTATLTFDGATALLDMGGGGTARSIGTAAAPITFNARQGTLQNLFQLNGGGTLTKTTANLLTLDGNLNYTGATTVSAGTLTYAATSIYSPAATGAAGGVLTVDGATSIANLAGTYTTAGNGNAFFQIQNGGMLNFSGTGNLNGPTSGGVRVGEASTGTLNLTAGTLNANLITGSNFVVGRSALGDGFLNVTGGILSNAGAGGMIIANTAGNNGVVTISGTGELVRNSAGAFTMGPGTSTLNLNTGGTFTLGVSLTASGTSTFNFDGGTLTASANITIPATLTTANVKNGGAIFNSNNNTITVAAALLHFAGATTDNLTKNGAGTLTLTGTNTYSGTTTITTGTLQLGDGTAGNDGTIGNSLSVVNNAALVYNRSGTPSYSGVISGGGTVTKLGGGTQTLTASNTYGGASSVAGGTLSVSGSLSGSTAIAVNNAATLLLSGGGTNLNLNTGANVTLGDATSNGTLAFNNSSTAGTPSNQTLNTLTLSSAPTIDFGTGTNATFNFSALTLSSFTGLTVAHWSTTGSFYSGNATADDGSNTDRLLFTNPTGLTGAQLATINFTDDNGAALGMGAMEVSFNGMTEIIPVPEPATAALIGSVALCALIRGRTRRRFTGGRLGVLVPCQP